MGSEFFKLETRKQDTRNKNQETRIETNYEFIILKVTRNPEPETT